MANLTGNERSNYVQNMFTRIAPRYDLMNRLMTFGQDMRWRRILIEKAALPEGGSVLDLGAGTGDIALAIQAARPDTRPTAADFTYEMMHVGRDRPGGRTLPWNCADALNLPYASERFNAVVSGFLMRNVTSIERALAEQIRVIVPGGRIVVLDTTKPPENLLAPFIKIHLNYVIPTLGKLITGEADAYNYLPDTTKEFLSAETLAMRMRDAGLKNVGFKRVMFGTIAIHWGTK